jgi:hypothetical protein
MRNNPKHLVAVMAFVAALAATPALYAYAQTGDSNSATMDHGMMGGGSMKGMMDMMGQMGQMAQNCNAMMTAMMTNHGVAPNEQGQNHAPQSPEGQRQGE